MPADLAARRIQFRGALRYHKLDMNPAPPLPRRPAFTLIELLVVISIIALLIAILLPSLSGARHEGRRAFCLSSLRQLAMASSAYSQDDRFAQQVAAPPNADSVGLIDGIYDYGGDNASPDEPDSPLLTIWGPTSPNKAADRPINRTMFGMTGGIPNSKVFRCPGDEGWVEAPRQPRSVAYTGFIGQPFWKATGTSYRANACRASAGNAPDLNAPLSAYLGLQGIYSMGPYLRHASKMPKVSELILYCESIMWEALWNSRAIDGEGVADFPGWHGRMTNFNVAFYDGHVSTVQLTKDNPFFEPNQRLWERGPGWQFDAMPEKLLTDRANRGIN